MRGCGFQEQKRSVPGLAQLLLQEKIPERECAEADSIKGSPAKDSHTPVTEESSRQGEDLQGTGRQR